nr:putative protein disulfide-isomerase [Quercus suber]
MIIQSTLAALLLCQTTSAFYTKSSPVLQLDASSYRSLIEKSNHTSIVEFYAPWCGHCKNLKPAYEKAAKSLTGLAKVAAVNCDEESNKPFCGSMGVQGFPTLKIVKPGKKAGKPIVEDYQGARTAKAIVDAVVDKIPNHVARLKDADYAAWLEADSKPKALLFSDKGATSALLKAIAVDFLGGVSVAQVRNKEKEMVEVFSVTKFPTFVLLPEDGRDPIIYDGEMKKEAMVAFLSQVATPNPDPPAKANKADKAKPSSSKSKSARKPSQVSETLETDATESPNPQVSHAKPAKVANVVPTPQSLDTSLALQQKCLNTKAGTCLLILLPDSPSASSGQALASLAEIAHKHPKLFPFFSIPTSNPSSAALSNALSLPASDVQIVATNGKRAWYLPPPPETGFTQVAFENWIDAIRMGDIPASAKQSLPASLLISADELPAEVKPSDVPLANDDKIKEATLKGLFGGDLPEGVQVEMDEIDDAEYERLMNAQQEQQQQQPDMKKDRADEGHVEL